VATNPKSENSTNSADNLRGILIALGAVIAEWHSRDRSAWIFLEMIICGFAFTSFANCLHTVLVAVDTLFPDPVDRFLDVRDAD
jgi:hypothetical protein